jgi:hypothetical protein
MGSAAIRNGLRLALVCCCGLAGCLGVDSAAVVKSVPPDPFVEELLRQEVLTRDKDSATLKNTVVLRDIPVKTPLAKARAFMEQHGFSCWANVPCGAYTCLHCTAYKRKRQDLADRVVVKLIYQDQKVIGAEVAVDYGVHHPDHSWVPNFSGK